MNKPNIQWKPISANNYSVGRQGTPIRKIAFHHIVGSLDSAYATFLNPNRQASAHFGIGDGRIFQFVDLDNTSWANGNWGSNLESITLEHEGDWRFGYWNEGVINTSAQLVAWLRTQYPGITYVRHRDVSSGVTVCPADLPVEEIWNRATNLMQKPDPIEPPAPKVSLQLTDIVNRKVVLNKNAKLWDLTFTSWSNAKAVKEYAKGTEIEVSATARHPLGGLYYLTEYSFSKGIMNGFNAIDCTDIVPPTPPEPPKPEPPAPEPPKPEPPVPPVPPTPEPEYPSWFIEFWVKLWEAIKSILKLK